MQQIVQWQIRYALRSQLCAESRRARAPEEQLGQKYSSTSPVNARDCAARAASRSTRSRRSRKRDAGLGDPSATLKREHLGHHLA